MQPHEREALAHIRAAIDSIEDILNEPKPAPEIVAASPAGIDVIAIPFFFVSNPLRAEVTRRVLRHFRNVADELDLVVIGVGSEGDVSRDLWREFFDVSTYSEYPQNWVRIGAGGHPLLRAKFDETLRRAAIYNPGKVFIGGSDDLIDADWFRRAFKSDADLIGVSGGAHVVRYIGGSHVEIFDWDGTYPGHPDIEFSGGGFVLSRAMLDAMDWAPFKEGADEIGVERRARRMGYKIEAINSPFFACKVPGAVLNDPRMAVKYGAQIAGAAVRQQWKTMWDSLQ
jgi:hypothetical protein